jgi:hypothetical protein
VKITVWSTISTKLKSSRIEIQLKVQQLLWHRNQIHEILSLLQLQVQLKVQQLLWHHNQIHEILSLLQLQVQLKVQQLLWHHNQIHEIIESSTIASSTTNGTNYNLHLDVDGGLTSFLYDLFSCQCIHILQVVDKKASI